MIKLIWAQNFDGAIGGNNSLLWHVPEDLKFLKQNTAGNVIVMGRKTYESLPVKPLPGRTNVVLSSNQLDLPEGVYQYSSIEEIVDNYAEFWVLGGASVYESFLPYASEILMTVVDVATPEETDTYAPDIRKVNERFMLDKSSEWFTSVKGNVSYSFRKYVLKS